MARPQAMPRNGGEIHAASSSGEATKIGLIRCPSVKARMRPLAVVELDGRTPTVSPRLAMSRWPMPGILGLGGWSASIR